MICAVIRVFFIATLLLTLGSAYAQERTPGSVARALSPRNANYNIDVRLDGSARSLTGRETIGWKNITNAATSELRFHLYYNAWRNAQSTYVKERRLARGWRGDDSIDDEDLSAIDITSLTVTPSGSSRTDLTSAMRFISPDDGNADDRTVVGVTLPSPVPPTGSVSIDISWTSKIPRDADRTGAIGNDFFLGQWFPKIGVLENNGMWNCHQFHAATEFFSDYGVYDVRMTVPRGWPLAATGEERDRKDNADGTTTYRYYQEDVHDFAWTTSPDFIERHERFDEAGLPPVDMDVTTTSRYYPSTGSGIELAVSLRIRDPVLQKLTLLKGGEPLPEEVVATEAQLTGSVRYLFEFVGRMWSRVTAAAACDARQLPRPCFHTRRASGSSWTMHNYNEGE